MLGFVKHVAGCTTAGGYGGEDRDGVQAYLFAPSFERVPVYYFT